ncbi:DUF2971 domain-containing protein [Rhizobium sp.]|uniref:DUF2971 domain-containing protein n=1 Tax=Rhizobium sp. TaxID=391 RepID=UPI003F7D990C
MTGEANTHAGDKPVQASGEFDGMANLVIGAAHGALPPSLFHYTSSQGLIGIVENHSLWFSDATFMNDGSELVWGVNLVGFVLDNFLADKSPEEKNAGYALREEVERAMLAFQPVTFSMSARNNLLNQWRDYGKDVVPYCIELETRSWLEHAGSSSFPMFVTKILYDVDQQRALITQLIALIYEKARNLLGERTVFDDNEATPLLMGAAVEIVKLITRFKNPAFSAEEEWRAVCYRPSVARKFRASSLGVVPYYEWRRTGAEKHLPIKSVTVGPSPYAEVSDRALRQFLEDNGYPVETSYSTIPIRR